MGVAVVTGAGSGLGRGIALALLDSGWQVALAGRRCQQIRGQHLRNRLPGKGQVHGVDKDAVLSNQRNGHDDGVHSAPSWWVPSDSGARELASASHNGSQYRDQTILRAGVPGPGQPKGRGPGTVAGCLGRGPPSLRPQRSARPVGYSLAETRSSVVGEASASAVKLSFVERLSSCG